MCLYVPKILAAGINFILRGKLSEKPVQLNMMQQPRNCLLYQMYAIFAVLPMFFGLKEMGFFSQVGYLLRRGNILRPFLSITIYSASVFVSVKVNVLELGCDLTVNKTLDQHRMHFAASPTTHSFSF